MAAKRFFLTTALLLFGLTSFLYAQSDGQNFLRRIAWRGDNNALRYAVEIDRLYGRSYQSHLLEFTTQLYLDISLPPGEYRFRIIPHDILDRPAEGTRWYNFEIHRTLEVSGERAVIDTADYEAAQTAKEKTASANSPKFHTIGVSVGTSFIDPLVNIAVHGSYAPIRNLYIEAGCNAGFVSKYDDVESFYCISPYANLGAFMPFSGRGGLFASAGGVYMIGAYKFSYGKTDISIFCLNVTAGINLFNFLNISYTLQTNFSDVKHKAALGYVYRFIH